MQPGGNLVDGVILELDIGPTLLFAQFQAHLGEEAALSRGLSCKGASGFRPCLKCGNVLKMNSGVIGPGPSALVEIDCVDYDKLVPNTDEEVWRGYDSLAAAVGTITRAEREQRQKAAGLTLVRNGVLSDVDLRQLFKPSSSHTPTTGCTHGYPMVCARLKCTIFCRPAAQADSRTSIPNWSFIVKHHGDFQGSIRCNLEGYTPYFAKVAKQLRKSTGEVQHQSS